MNHIKHHSLIIFSLLHRKLILLPHLIQPFLLELLIPCVRLALTFCGLRYDLPLLRSDQVEDAVVDAVYQLGHRHQLTLYDVVDYSYL